MLEAYEKFRKSAGENSVEAARSGERFFRIIRHELGHDDSALEPGAIWATILKPEEKQKALDTCKGDTYEWDIIKNKQNQRKKMPRRARNRRIPNTLESRMALHSFMCCQFGYNDLREMLNQLDNLSHLLDNNQSSLFCQAILMRIQIHSSVTKDDLIRYDTNILAHSQSLGITDEKGKSWKPFQYIALLFTERYLDLYFQDKEMLVEKLNNWKKTKYGRYEMDDYTTDDLHTLAFQSATGSGKTLLLHANILQYKHYLGAAKRLHKLNKIILVTPDEGLSRQHLRELQASNIPARLFSDTEEPGLFSRSGVIVDIIDLHKFAEKKGIKTVVPEFFEENNLVMVDEGHLGVGGKKWREYRKRLATNGFTFEYSATFNQAVSGSGDEIKKLRDDYGKAILFDYSYKFFYADGYGKDYKISNLQRSDDGEANNFYLLACLLSFYQQCSIYEDQSGEWQRVNIAPPLWVFLGKTVTGGKSAGKKETETDVIKIIKFLAWVLSEQRQVVNDIQRLISGTTGLIDEKGAEIFSDSFPYIKTKTPKEIYDDLCSVVFHAKGRLTISHLTGADELQLCASDSNPFGVINVGDASGLYTKLETVESPLFSLTKNAFKKPLFADVDNDNSPVNIVIGARKFAAGWNSWRVSTMGLMHVGSGEGPQIIQMFGRGIRLKGSGMSLKRHTTLESISTENSSRLKLLETLNIFGLKANYMDKFKNYLQKEGIKVDRVVFTLPTKKQFGKVKDLKILKKRDDVGEFQFSDARLVLPDQPDVKDNVTIDRRKYLQYLQSDGNQTGNKENLKQAQTLEKKHLDLLNTQSIYHRVLKHKRRAQWHNITISRQTVDALLEKNDWYELYISPEKLAPSEYGRVREWENLAVDLICEYASKYWRRERNKWEHEHIEIVSLDAQNPNYVEEYQLSVDNSETELIRNIEKLAKQVESGDYKESFQSGNFQLSLFNHSLHAYRPLLHIPSGSGASVQITPVALDENEAEFVLYLQDIANYQHNVDFLQGKEIYLMRNLSRGKGVSFFDDYSFYPDFILWVKDSKRQDILFIDPKGLVHFNSKVISKVDLHTRIKETEKKIQKKNPGLFLHSYIWSGTRPKDIGSDEPMSPESCREKGIYFAQQRTLGMRYLLEHALR